MHRKAEAIVETMATIGYPVRIVEGYRSHERQAELYAQGRTTPGNIVTNAMPGQSLHQYGVAVDFVFRREGYNAPDWQWEILGKVGEAQGFEWGGRWTGLGFVDLPHFQLTLNYTLADFQANRIDWSRYQ